MKKRAHMIGAIIFAVLAYYMWHFLHRALFIPPDPSLHSTLTSILSMEVFLFFIMIFSSMFGGTLPDILDPPFTSHHRAFAHSKALLLVFTLAWLIALYVLLVGRSTMIWGLYFFLSGYISHLLMDSRTPAGLQ
ncbi:MAG: hypothetical protein ACOC55_03340 [Candidatus Natronoplasma sp.]